MRIIGNLSDSDVDSIIHAAEAHPAFGSTQQVSFLYVNPDGSIEVGTIPKDRTANGSWKRDFTVRRHADKYLVDDQYAEYS